MIQLLRVVVVVVVVVVCTRSLTQLMQSLLQKHQCHHPCRCQELAATDDDRMTSGPATELAQYHEAKVLIRNRLRLPSSTSLSVSPPLHSHLLPCPFLLFPVYSASPCHFPPLLHSVFPSLPLPSFSFIG